MSSENFLSRWSKRKQAVQRSEKPCPEPDPASESAAPEVSPHDVDASDMDDKPVAPSEPELNEDELARLPSLEDLTADTDISIFMRRGVPEPLRNAALRRMWSLDPAIRDFVCEAREYAYDWNTPGGVPGFGGPLPPQDEIERLAAQIVGAMKPESETLPKPEQPTGSSSLASQNREISSLGSGRVSGASLQQEAITTTSLHQEELSQSTETMAVEQVTTEPASGRGVAGAPDATADIDTGSTRRPPVRRHGGAKPL